MKHKRFFTAVGTTLLATASALFLPLTVNAASSLKVLYQFRSGADGSDPTAGMIFDPAGNLYGTTLAGGMGWGTVFKLIPNSDGSWSESVLYRFTGGSDGSQPRGVLTIDATGNLYGTTTVGGTFGIGTVFRLQPNSDGTWIQSVLYNFADDPNGSEPHGGVTKDASGNLFGTTSGSGQRNSNCSGGCGTVFRLAPNSDGTWTLSTLHTFTGGQRDGSNPLAEVIFDSAGNLFGTTPNGGPTNDGVAFKLSPRSDGSWSESFLHSFKGNTGSLPKGRLLVDQVGNLYGTTESGGTADGGVVFRLSPGSTGWTYKVLHAFLAKPLSFPIGGLTVDAAGSLYGSAFFGGGKGCDGCGGVFKLTPSANDTWQYSVVRAFNGVPVTNPNGDLIFDEVGHLYGTAQNCVFTSCFGTIFEISP